MIDTRATPAEFIAAYARAMSLFALRQALKVGGLGRDRLSRLDIDTVERACKDPDFRLWAAAVVLRGCDPSPADALNLFDSMTFKRAQVHVLSTPAHLVEFFFGADAALIEDPDKVRTCFRNAEALLEECHIPDVLSLVRSIDLIAGIEGKVPQELQLLYRIPGLVLVPLDQPSNVILEHVIRGATGAVFEARLALDPFLEVIRTQTHGVLSPFEDRAEILPQAIRNLLQNGVVWSFLSALARREETLGRDQKAIRSGAGSRATALHAKLQLASRCILDGAGPETLSRVGEVFAEMTGTEPPWSVPTLLDRRMLVENAGYSPEISGLPPLQLAELLVACKGMKVSRLSIATVDVKRVGFALAANAAVVTSGRATLPKLDLSLPGFSNVSEGTTSLADAPTYAVVYFYVHCDDAFSRLAAALDHDGSAGELLGIPLCCRRWYSSQWPATAKAGGDLFAVMVRAAARNGVAHVAQECDTSSMYRGGGLCWHFPCSPTCSATIDAISARRALIEKFDPALLAELQSSTRSIFTLKSDGSYVDGEWPDEGAVVVSVS